MHYHFKTIPSTQIFARHYMRCLRPGHTSDQWFLFSADAQTQGEGTHKRPWYSPPGNLLATFAFYMPKTQKDHLVHLSQVSMLAVAQAVEALAGIKPQIKWINDLLINQKKVAGVLCESFGSRLHPQYYVILVGIGLNINLSRTECEQIDQPATSLWVETGRHIDKDALMTQIETHLHTYMPRLLNQGFADFKAPLAYFGLQA